jgi:LPS sulfotransferase NodH
MTKFILLGHRRSGSTLLFCDLVLHRNIYMFGELFNESEEERRRAFRSGLQGCTVAQRRGLDESMYYRDGQDGAEFLRNLAFYERYWQPVAVGFKLFYHQARDTNNARKAWDYLISDRDVRIVHIMRRNMLDSMLSLRIALQTNEWARCKGEAPSPAQMLNPLRLTPVECEDYFSEVERERQWARESFSEHPMLEVEYETDLCRRFQATMYRVHDFLGVPRRRARKMLEKQAQRTPAEQLCNYGELKAYFARTPYASLFK